jgi:hypothetical protein
VLILGLLLFGLVWVAGKVLGGLTGLLGTTIGMDATSLVLGTLHSVAAVVGYHDLRREKEGVAVAELVKVFE